jgi:pyridoxamine 5'-phosphate oxidase
MEENLHNYRKTYQKGKLLESEIDANPLQQFRKWFYEAKESDQQTEPNAMTLSTLGIDGFPKGRIVLLKKYDEFGFYFYTNYESEKGKAIEAYNKVSLLFFWPVLERQVIIKGIAEKTSEIDSVNYFETRPLGSKLGAWVSKQSSVISDRAVLENQLLDVSQRFKDKPVPKPENWGGYLVKPKSIEFWQGRPNRLHDRILYTLEGIDWKIQRLAP